MSSRACTHRRKPRLSRSGGVNGSARGREDAAATGWALAAGNGAVEGYWSGAVAVAVFQGSGDSTSRFPGLNHVKSINGK